MADELVIDGIHVASDVIETVISMSLIQVESVAAVGSAKNAQKGSRQRKKSAKGFSLSLNDEELLVVDIHIAVWFGFQLKEAALEVREAIANALQSQLGIEVSAVNVYIDSIEFAD